jgi:hypothetical protein
MDHPQGVSRMSQVDSAQPPVANEELGSYRSLSTFAVLSAVLGLLSILAFAPSQVFVFLFPPAAVVFGLLGLRQVTVAPEVWTGRRLSKFGIGLGLICAVGSMSTIYVNNQRIGRHGKIIADRFVNKLRAGDTEGAFWLKMPREARLPYLGKQSGEGNSEVGQQFAIFHAETDTMSKALASGEATIEFESIEHTIIDHGTEYAAIVYSYRSPQEDTHVMILASSFGMSESRNRSWFIREVQAGYSPHSYAASKSASHGHSH